MEEMHSTQLTYCSKFLRKSSSVVCAQIIEGNISPRNCHCAIIQQSLDARTTHFVATTLLYCVTLRSMTFLVLA